MLKKDLHWKRAIKLPLGFAAVLVAFFVMTALLPQSVSATMAIFPRDISHLQGIFLHPLLQFSLMHIISNAIGIVILGTLISLYSSRYFMIITAAGWIFGGILIWLFARGSGMVGGASGIVFSYLGFLMLYGFFAKKWLPVILSVVTVYFFHGSLLGLFPTYRAISWEGHLAGFVVGIVCAYYLGKKHKAISPS